MDSTRRDFLESAATLFGGGWLALSLPQLERLCADARTACAAGLPFETLSAAEARTMTAFAAQIIPTTDTPGATEAGAIHFIDKSLGSFAADSLPLIRAGLKDLDERAKKKRGVTSFADLGRDDQITIMTEIEAAPFFGNARMATLIGTFGDPRHGGNRQHIGYRIMNIDHRPVYQPPFGHYDAQATKASGQ